MIWHQFMKHRVDPKEHQSRKAAKHTQLQKLEQLSRQRKAKQEDCRQSKRKAPEIDDDVPDTGGSLQRKARLAREFFQTQGRLEERLNPCLRAMQLRMKHKEEANITVAPISRIRMAEGSGEQGQPKVRRTVFDCSTNPSRTFGTHATSTDRRGFKDDMRQRIQQQHLDFEERKIASEPVGTQNSSEGKLASHANGVQGDRVEHTIMQVRELGNSRIQRCEMHAMDNILNAGRSVNALS